jgi:hypothetical protein
VAAQLTASQEGLCSMKLVLRWTTVVLDIYFTCTTFQKFAQVQPQPSYRFLERDNKIVAVMRTNYMIMGEEQSLQVVDDDNTTHDIIRTCITDFV